MLLSLFGDDAIIVKSYIFVIQGLTRTVTIDPLRHTLRSKVAAWTSWKREAEKPPQVAKAWRQVVKTNTHPIQLGAHVPM